MLNVARKFMDHVVPGVARPLNIIWNQVIGFFFLVLAAIPVPSALRDLHDPNSYPKLMLSIPFTLVMASFGIASFFKARKISRS